MIPTNQQGSFDEPTFLERAVLPSRFPAFLGPLASQLVSLLVRFGRLAACGLLVGLLGISASGFSQDEPDPFATNSPVKADPKKVEAKKDAAKKEALKKAKETGEEPDPFLMNDLKGDPDAKEIPDTPANPLEAIQAIAEEMMEAGGGIVMDEIQVGGGFVAAKKEKKEDGEKNEPLKHKDEDVQLKISKLLDKMSDGERQKRSSFMGVVIEDIARLSGLDEAATKRLEVAAKGATERSMQSWYDQADRYVQGRMKGATKDNADQMLASIGNVSFGGRDAEKKGEDEDLWKESLAKVLSDKQVNDYKEVVDERKRYSEKAFAMVVMATLDEHLRLTPQQHAKLTPLAEGATTEYLDQIRKYWGDYFEKRMLMSLLGGADLDEIKSVLTEKQYDRWEGSTADFDHFWDQRRKEKKEKHAAEKKAETQGKNKKGGKAEEKEKGEIEVGNIDGGGARFFAPLPKF